MQKRFRKKTGAAGILLAVSLLTVAVTVFSGCGVATDGNKTEANQDEVTITVFAAKSLNTVMEELISVYGEQNPGVTVIGNYDSSGTLLAQIKEGASCDVFFSAAESQMDELEKEGFVTEGTRYRVVNNRVCVVTYKGSGTKVTGLSDMEKASGIALAAGSVPVGKYTRCAMINSGMIETEGDAASVETGTISEALGGVEINECANVGAVTAAVAEGANEVGTVYYSDLYGLENQLEILEMIPYELTGEVIYPVAQVKNSEADDAQREVALAFVKFLISDEAKEIFETYYFDTEIEN